MVDRALPEDLKRLRALISYVGSREKLAEEINISSATIDYWFIKQANIPSKYLHRLSKSSNGIFTPLDFIRSE